MNKSTSIQLMDQRRQNLNRNQEDLELNDNKNTTYENLWDIAKALFRGEFIVLNACIRKEERLKSNNLSKHHKKLEYEEQNKLK